MVEFVFESGSGLPSAVERMRHPIDIADVVAFLAGETVRWITGQTIRVNGGTI